MQKITWIFFDMGSTLIDETEADLRRILEMTAGTGVTMEAYCEKRLEMIRQGKSGDQGAMDYFGLIKTPWHHELEKPYEDAAPVLETLRSRGFKLGVIANQNLGAEERLMGWGLRHFFDVVAASAELGMAKPDPGIFLWALAQAGCQAREAAMVGDRLDNDMAPANELGMCSIRLLRDLGALHEPQSQREIPDHTIQSLEEIPGLLEELQLAGGSLRDE